MSETDLRQGVTPVEHRVLDAAERLLAAQPLLNAEGWLDFAKGRVAQAKRTTHRHGAAVVYAIEAAAALMIFAEAQQRYLANLRGQA